MQSHAGGAHHGHRRGGRGRGESGLFRQDPHLAELGQHLQQRRGLGDEVVAVGQQRHALRRREVHFRAQRTHRRHEGLEFAHPFDGGCVHALQLRFRIGSDHQAVYVVLGLAAGHRGHPFPQLGRDEGGERVQQTQDGFQGADQRAARGALFRRPALLDLHLGDLQVPIAVLVPDEAVQRVGHVVQAVLGKALLHRSLHTLDLAADPAVGR